jgi:hypothetical protein
LEGPFNIEEINFIRFFMVGEQIDHDITVKIDNFRLSDWNAVSTAAKKEELAKEKADKFVADVAALGDITAENYVTLKSDVEALRSAYDKLNDLAKEYVTKAALDDLATAEAKIAEFEANPPSVDNGNENTGNDKVDDDATGSGCGATVAFGGVAILTLAGVVVLRKKED